jgi:hypothetical protein
MEDYFVAQININYLFLVYKKIISADQCQIVILL